MLDFLPRLLTILLFFGRVDDAAESISMAVTAEAKSVSLMLCRLTCRRAVADRRVCI